MQKLQFSLLCILSLVTLFAYGTQSSSLSVVQRSHKAAAFDRSLFPRGFVFGLGSSAYQSEGATSTDGRGPSIWDTYTKKHPEKIWDHSSDDLGTDFYHRYKSDIKMMKEMGLDSFRFSISWSRIFPKGKGAVNNLGVKFYHDLINEVLSNGLIPFVTIFHWDLPQALEDEYGGFLSPKVVADFHAYADFCFKTFGDRVKHWVTLNEPFTYSLNGYHGGSFAPGRCSKYIGNCTAGDSATEPYIVAHNLILAHADAAKLYKNKYKVRQKGEIGITLVSQYLEPKSNNVPDQEAASRGQDFFFGWFAHPITYGDYPQSMRSSVGDRLPRFTKEQSENLKNSYEFLGVNYYTSFFAENIPPTSINRTYYTDMQAKLSPFRNFIPIGPPTGLKWLYIYPKGLHRLMIHIKDKYMNPQIYITENGMANKRNDMIPIDVSCKDRIRISYHEKHLRSLLDAIKDGVNVKGYYAWSFSDSYEWDAGYTVRFGLIYVDYKNNLTRHSKYSASWLKKFLLK